MSIQTQTVEYSHNKVMMKGHLAWDDAKQGKRPGVLVCHEWWGLNDHIRGVAEKIARELGYVAFALEMFGNGETAKDHQQAGKLMNALMTNPDAMGRVKSAIEVISKRPECDASKLASIGYCMGGSMSLHMARAGLPLRGVAAIHGNLKAHPPTPASPQPIAAKLLIAVGAEDPMIPIADIEGFENEMRQAKADYQIIIYGNARHAFTNPNADKAGLPPLKYDANADRRSWKALKDFLNEALA